MATRRSCGYALAFSSMTGIACVGPASSTDEAAPTSTSTETETETASDDTSTTAATGQDDNSTGPGFVDDNSIPGPSSCDPWFQDCPDGEKCVPYSAVCPDGLSCMVPMTSQGAVTLCVADCDPLQGCLDGFGCYWLGATFTCAAAGELGLGSECNAQTECAAGSFCLDASLSDCLGDGCCCSYCRLSDPICERPGSSCMALFDDPPPPDYADLGICI